MRSGYLTQRPDNNLRELKYLNQRDVISMIDQPQPEGAKHDNSTEGKTRAFAGRIRSYGGLRIMTNRATRVA